MSSGLAYIAWIFKFQLSAKQNKTKQIWEVMEVRDPIDKANLEDREKQELSTGCPVQLTCLQSAVTIWPCKAH